MKTLKCYNVLLDTISRLEIYKNDESVALYQEKAEVEGIVDL